MNLTDMISIVQTQLDDSGVHYTQSGVSEAINEGYQLTCLMTLCFEKNSHSWDSYSVESAQQRVPMPSDCIVPIHVYDRISGNRIFPVTISELKLNDSTWWSSTGSRHEYYTLFNPCWSSGTESDTSSYSMVIYPLVASTTQRIKMIYAAHPGTLTSGTSQPKVPSGQEHTLTNYGTFMGLIRQRAQKQTKLASEFLKLFFDSINVINSILLSRYPGGRDFEPRPIEDLLKRHLWKGQEKKQERRRSE